MKEKKNNKPEKKNNNTPEYYHNGKLYIELIFLKCYNNKGVNKSEIMTELNRIFSDSKLLTLSSIKNIEETIIFK